MMELMKFDCGGAAAILGAARAIAQLEPKQVEVHFVVAACEVWCTGKYIVAIICASLTQSVDWICSRPLEHGQ